MLYVTHFNNDESTMIIIGANSWDEHQQLSNESFEAMLKSDKDYDRLFRKIFYICEGNYHVTFSTGILIGFIIKMQHDITRLIA